MAAIEVVDQPFRKRAQEACSLAKAGDSQKAADAVEALKDDVAAAKKKAASEQSDCQSSIDGTNRKAKDEAASAEADAGVVSSDKEDLESQISTMNAQKDTNDKAKAEMAEAQGKLHSVMQAIRFAANSGKDLLQSSLKEVSAGKDKISDAIAASDKLAAASEEFDTQSQAMVSKVTGELDDSTRMVNKVLIPLKTMHADTEEDAVNIKEEEEQSQAANVPTCDASALAAKVAKLGTYEEHLGNAAESLAYDTLR